MILWVALALLTAGGLISIIGTLSPVSHRIQDASVPALSETKIPEKSIAVLPFESLSDNKSDTYFADGVQDEILSNLAKVSQLKVISRTSVMTYRSTNNRNLRSIANALGVAKVVEGTVRRDGNRVRVTTELVDARTDQTLLALKQDAIAEAQRAVEMLSISKDVMDGPSILMNLAVVYAWTDEPDLAFEKLGLLTRTPHGIYYGQLKLERLWDPLRTDPRFDKLLAQLAPKQ